MGDHGALIISPHITRVQSFFEECGCGAAPVVVAPMVYHLQPSSIEERSWRPPSAVLRALDVVRQDWNRRTRRLAPG